MTKRSFQKGKIWIKCASKTKDVLKAQKMLKIFPVETNEDIESVKILLEEYLAWMEIEKLISAQEFQAFQEQLANLLNGFAQPTGCLLVAMYQDENAGCVALRKLTDSICEMKRLYVRKKFRGMGIGRKLAECVIGEARRLGYARIRVHTLRAMEAANTLYEALGFKQISPYEESLIEGGVFMELKLV